MNITDATTAKVQECDATNASPAIKRQAQKIIHP